MSSSFQIDRRAFLNGLGGAALALPVLDVMGAEATAQVPRRLQPQCSIHQLALDSR